MELDGENGLGQIHLVVGVQNGVAHGAGQVLARRIPAADDDVLGNGPAPGAHIEEDKEMLKEGGGFRPAQIVGGPVGFENAVSVAHREGEGVGGLLNAHDLPEEDVALHGLEGGPGAEFRDPAQGFGQDGIVLGFGDFRVAVGQLHGAAEAPAEGTEVDGVGLISMGELFLDLRQQGRDAFPQRPAEVGDQMARDLFDEKCHFFGVFAAVGVDIVQIPDVVAVCSPLTHGGDSFGGHIAVGSCVAVDRQRIAVAPEGLHLEGGIDQGVAGGEGVPLGACENGMVADVQGELVNDGFQLQGGLFLFGEVQTLRGVGGDLPGQEPAVEDRPGLALLIKEGLRLGGQNVGGKLVENVHIGLPFLCADEGKPRISQGAFELLQDLRGDPGVACHGVFQI